MGFRVKTKSLINDKEVHQTIFLLFTSLILVLQLSMHIYENARKPGTQYTTILYDYKIWAIFEIGILGLSNSPKIHMLS